MTLLGIGIITIIPQMNVIISVMCFGIVVCMMHGINNVVTSMAPLKMRDIVASGKMAGILNGFCYVGSTISSYTLSKIADISGWQTVLNTLLILSICSILISVLGSKYCKSASK